MTNDPEEYKAEEVNSEELRIISTIPRKFNVAVVKRIEEIEEDAIVRLPTL